jgi:hypothetical protein
MNYELLLLLLLPLFLLLLLGFNQLLQVHVQPPVPPPHDALLPLDSNPLSDLICDAASRVTGKSRQRTVTKRYGA